MKMIEQKFKIGDIVRIIQTGVNEPDSWVKGVKLSNDGTHLIYQVGEHNYTDDQIELVPPVLSLWLLIQNDVRGYDTFDSCVVCATTEDEARKISPDSYDRGFGRTWARTPDHVVAEYIGIAAKLLKAGDVICASFNAG